MTETVASHDLSSSIPLEDPTFYTRDLDEIHAVFTRVRHEQPVFWHEPGGFWVLMKHADIRHVGSNPLTFSSRFGFQIGDSFPVEQVMPQLPVWAQDQLRAGGLTRAQERGIIARAKVSIGDPEIESIVVTDPPRHQAHRKILTRALSPKLVRDIEPAVASIVDRALDEVERGETIEFVGAVAAKIPPLVIATLLGVPEDDMERFVIYADAFMATVILNERDPVKAARNQELAGEFSRYIFDLVDERRARPQDDVVSAIVQGELEGGPVPEKIAMMLIRSLIAGGGDTSKHLLSLAVHDLGLRPDQRQLLRERPDLSGNAIQEVLRWSPIVWSEARTALEDVEIRGETIREGDFIVMIFPSANRDEDEWLEPFTFDVARTFSVQTMAFGWGEHMCPGNPLARLEGRVLIERLLARFKDFEVVGDPARFTSSFINGMKTLDVVLT